MHDVVIIGGGHNGLTCAGYLARAGLDVVVLEKNPVVGGAALTEEFHPGFRNSVASYTVSLLNPKVIRDLGLAGHGLKIIDRPAANFWPLDASRSLLLPWDGDGRRAAIGAISARDASRLPEFEAALGRAAAVLRGLALETPPNAGGGLVAAARAGWAGRGLMRLPIADQRTVLDLFTLSVADFLAQWFESDEVRAAFSFDGLVGAYASPSTPGTAYVLLHHCFGEVNGRTGVWGHAVGGMGAITQAMARSAKAHGTTIRTESPVAELIIANGSVQGVRLKSGEVVSGRVVAANVGPKLLFRSMIAPEHVDAETAARFASIKTGSGTFRMNVALRELPDFRCRPGTALQPHHTAGIVIGPSLDYLEAAYDDARRDGWSKRPVVEMLIPSTIDDTLAPKGQHVASLFVQHVAPKLPTGRSWTDDRERDAFADIVIDTVTEHAPNFKDAILGRQVLSPLDLERKFGLIDGDIFHGQLSLNQLFAARPVLGFADYRMPIKGLYLCGSGAHPGGGVTGLPGHNAAREIIRDLMGWRRRVFAARGGGASRGSA